jgi:hypothetical protein
VTSRDFAFWLQGYLELTPGQPAPLSAEQVDKVRRHLALVFIHDIDPSLKLANKRLEDLAQKIHDDAMKPLPSPVFYQPTDARGEPLMRC